MRRGSEFGLHGLAAWPWLALLKSELKNRASVQAGRHLHAIPVPGTMNAVTRGSEEQACRCRWWSPYPLGASCLHLDGKRRCFPPPL